jgi:hypothetical protein
MALTMKIAFFDLTEDAVERILEHLSSMFGMMYDEDFTCIYGREWKAVGIEFMTNKAARAALYFVDSNGHLPEESDDR